MKKSDERKIGVSVAGIFPIPVYKAMLDREFTSQELRFVEQMKTECIPNVGNILTTNTYILDVPAFATLKKEMNLFVEDYLSKVLSPPAGIIPYITQSWLNYTKENQYHPSHLHPNSYISGVFYINADKAHDGIIFHQNTYDQIKLPVTKGNLFNADRVSIPVESGEIIMFPSNLVHSVEKKKGNNTRVSLSFNVFVKGNLGDERQRTELKI